MGAGFQVATATEDSGLIRLEAQHGVHNVLEAVFKMKFYSVRLCIFLFIWGLMDLYFVSGWQLLHPNLIKSNK